MKSIHALLVDDDKQSLETMGLILEMDDYQVSRAESGLKALEILERSEEHPPAVDFLVVDLDMDNLSGIELLTEMRRRGHTVPVMVVTGFASKGTVVELLRHGVADFLDKPIHMEEFRIRVRQIANEALRRRRRAVPGPAEPAVPEIAPFRSVTVLDLGNLGIPYALRRLVESPDRNNLVMACRRQDGFDILLADVPGNDAESFYASVLIKTFFDRCRAQRMESGAFMSALNRVILEGALKKRDLGAIFIRVHHAERRIEIHPAGLPCQCFLGLRGATPRNLAFAGSPLGVVPEPGITSCVFPYARGDRIFLVSETDASRRQTAESQDPALRIHESLLSGRHESLDITADGIWRDLLSSAPKGESSDSLLLGLELI
jgi:DNA-binding response OmpR family regulator